MLRLEELEKTIKTTVSKFYLLLVIFFTFLILVVKTNNYYEKTWYKFNKNAKKTSKSELNFNNPIQFANVANTYEAVYVLESNTLLLFIDLLVCDTILRNYSCIIELLPMALAQLASRPSHVLPVCEARIRAPSWTFGIQDYR